MSARGPPVRRRFGEPARRQLAAAAQRLFARHPEVLAAYLYGSAARGGPAADLDVAVLFEGPPDASSLEPFAAELQREGAPGGGPEIDLRTVNGAAPRFRFAVVREGWVLYERDRRARQSWEARSMSLWADFKPTWDRMRRRMLDRWIRG